jgi:hypothetical protein
MTTKRLRLIEFIFIGVIMGLAEDLIAVTLATDAKLDWRIFFIVLFVALPFAFISEIVVDHPLFWERWFKFIKRVGDPKHWFS